MFPGLVLSFRYLLTLIHTRNEITHSLYVRLPPPPTHRYNLEYVTDALETRQVPYVTDECSQYSDELTCWRTDVCERWDQKCFPGEYCSVWATCPAPTYPDLSPAPPSPYPPTPPAPPSQYPAPPYVPPPPSPAPPVPPPGPGAYPSGPGPVPPPPSYGE